MVLRTVSEASTDLYQGFYVPRFEVRIEGAGLPDDVLRDVIEVKYKDSIDELDTFQLTVNNWEAEHNRFKYIGDELPETLKAGDERGLRQKLFEPCEKQVGIYMGYGASLSLMITGTFTTMEPEFSPSAAATLNVRGINVLHQLRRIKYDDQFKKKKPSQIAKLIGKREDKKLKAKRFPMDIETVKKAEAEEKEILVVNQKQEYDIDFLWKQARKVGHVVTILEPVDDKPRRLYFGPTENAENRVQYELEWGKSLIQCSPRLTTANQYKSVTVNGWDRNSQKVISYKADLSDPKLRKLNPDLHEMINVCDPREELVVDEPVFSKDEAKQKALAILSDQLKQMVKINGTTIGLPELRAGAIVSIKGIGSRLSGDYFVEETEHILNDSGYQTKFQARREDIPSSSSSGQGRNLGGNA